MDFFFWKLFPKMANFICQVIVKWYYVDISLTIKWFLGLCRNYGSSKAWWSSYLKYPRQCIWFVSTQYTDCVLHAWHLTQWARHKKFRHWMLKNLHKANQIEIRWTPWVSHKFYTSFSLLLTWLAPSYINSII